MIVKPSNITGSGSGSGSSTNATVTPTVALSPSYVAVITDMPADKAVTTPVSLTVATASLLVL
ncbi:hypothetical protein D3C77_428640 [compost metagenome]